MMGLFGAKKRRTREIAHEVLKPLGVDLKDLTERSQANFEGEMRRVVNMDKDNELYNRQTGWRHDEKIDATQRKANR
jgi:hypothetical protein